MQATTAIEGNTLPLEQVTALLDGKRVRGPAREVAEVENAIAAYAPVPTLDPFAERDLLRAHAILLKGLVAARLELAARHFGTRSFSRKDYLELHPALSAPTASRDLREGVERSLPRIDGDKRTARYAFRRARSTR